VRALVTCPQFCEESAKDIFQLISARRCPESEPSRRLNSRNIRAVQMAPSWTAVAVWRLDGSETVELPMDGVDAHILYPADLGINIQAVNRKLNVRFPRPRMGCIVCV